MENEILQLEKRVDDLTVWIESKIKERLVYPLDLISRNIIDSGLFVFTGVKLNSGYLSVLTNHMIFDFEVKVKNNTAFPGNIKEIRLGLPLYQFTANSATDFITNTAGQHNLQNGDRITITGDGSSPTPLDIDEIYYVVNRTGNTFQLALTYGGSAIDITFGGSDNHYYAKL